ncbi:MAG: PSP1 domain-containing protein [Desulfovibrio sp.]|uniref:PSP1 domain-containing protein n=1 Tax=Desulfovibrio sp. 7SRBS1 TaxID=3378064 RepID=UPI003B3F1D56
MSRILGAKFRDFGQIYYFDSGPYVVEVGDHVIVETDQGRGLAKVAVVRKDVPEDVSEESVKTIFRLANSKDFEIIQENNDLSRQAYGFCRKCIESRKLEMKLVDVEIFYDRSKMIFYFTAPGRVDFRELVKDLVREYRTRIELRQIGVRHETQMIGAVGNCGQVCCCRRFMRTFDPVTIKMAKEQNLFLNPTKISGICGRLLCCLNFEQKNYEDFQRKCPKIGKRHNTSMGVVKVIRSNFFRNSLTLITENHEEREVCVDDWKDLQAGKTLPPQNSGKGDASECLSKGTDKGKGQGADADNLTQNRGEQNSPCTDSANETSAAPAKSTALSENSSEERKPKKSRGKSRGGRSRRGASRRRGRGSKSSDNAVSGRPGAEKAGRSNSEKGKSDSGKDGQSKVQKPRAGQRKTGQGNSEARKKTQSGGSSSGKTGQSE